MAVRLERRGIALGAGRSVSAVVALPEERSRRGVTVILAHGAGNDMHAPFLSAIHEGLAERGYVTVKFNFPYKEAGGRAPDRAPVLEDCYRHVVAAVRDDAGLTASRLVIGGKSLGGRIATHLAAAGEPVAGLILLGYPLHPPGNPDRLRVAHLHHIAVPMLFFAGTRDTLCTLDLLQRTLEEIPAATHLHVIDGGDHSFDLPKRMGRSAAEVRQEIIGATADWLEALASSERTLS
jgi:hypothetical protein